MFMFNRNKSRQSCKSCGRSLKGDGLSCVCGVADGFASLGYALQPTELAKPQEEARVPSMMENWSGDQIAYLVLGGMIGLTMLLVATNSSTSKTREYSPSHVYQSNSPYAPSARTSRDIDKMSGTAAEKAAAKDAVRRFNEAAAKRGDRPTGL